MNAWEDMLTLLQENAAIESMPILQAVALNLVRISDEILEKHIPYNEDNSADKMVLSFTQKQLEHFRSLRILIDAEAHRDSALIARAMLEGYGRLQWALADQPKRTELWKWYGLILDWRQVQANENHGFTYTDKQKVEIGALMAQHGEDYIKDKLQKKQAAAKEAGVVKPLPADPWAYDWTNVSVRSMFESFGALEMYDGMYRSMSECGLHPFDRTTVKVNSST